MVTQQAVQVSRGTLIALAAALAISVLAVAFLVGRESGRIQPAPPVPPVVMVTTPPAAAVPPPPGIDLPPTVAPYGAPGAPVEASVPATSVAAPFTPPATYASPAPSSHDTLRDAVAAYFRNVDTIQSRAKSWNDPEALARTLLEQGSRGDTSGFDGLAAANRKVRDDLRALDVPEPCREHHRATLALVEESVSMLERVKSQLQGSDTSSLTAIAGSGQDLERKAKDVDAQAAEIKRRFGL
jgi:hypothetical protein